MPNTVCTHTIVVDLKGGPIASALWKQCEKGSTSVVFCSFSHANDCATTQALPSKFYLYNKNLHDCDRKCSWARRSVFIATTQNQQNKKLTTSNLRNSRKHFMWQRCCCFTCDKDTGVLLRTVNAVVALIVPPDHLPGWRTETATGSVLTAAETATTKQAQ